jgi:hypothetical protein
MDGMTEHTAAQAVHDAVGQVTFGPLVGFENLTVVPLLGGEERDVDYLTLDEALAGGLAEITEVSDAGRVSELRVVVTGDKPVLLVDGEELVGAKQNRVLNLTILVPARSTTVIPVSCVEAGRWQHQSRGFAAASRNQFAEGRAARVQQVTASMLHAGARRSDQGAVWDLIAAKEGRMGARSATGAMSAMFEHVGASLDEFVAALPPLPRQVGAVFFVNGQPAGLELFDAASTWRRLSPKLVRSYAVDAIDRRGGPAPDAADTTPDAFASAVRSSPASAFPAVGDGEDVRLTGAAITGAALVAHGRVIHVNAFPGTLNQGGR